MSPAERMCPLHGTACNLSDPVHATSHRQARENAKTFYYTVLWSPGSDPAARKAVEDYLDSIPTGPPRPPNESNPRIPL